MIRSLIILLFLFITSAIHSQYYISEIAPEAIDDLKIEGDSLYAAGDYEASSESYKELRDYWDLVNQEGNVTDDQFQNYIFSEVYYRKVLSKIGERTTSAERLRELVQLVTDRLGSDHLINGCLYHEMGVMILVTTANYKEAYEFTYQAMLIREEKLPEYKKDLGWSYNNLSVIHRHLQEFDKSETYLFKALKVRREINPPEPAMILATYLNLSQLQIFTGDRDKYREYLEKAEEAGKNLDVNHPFNLRVRTALAKVYYDQGKFKEAILVTKRALTYRRTLFKGEGKVELTDNYSGLVENYLALGYLDSASVYLDTILNLRDKYNIKESIVNTYQRKSIVETDPDKAILLLREALRLCPEDSQCNSGLLAMTNRMISDQYLKKDDAYQALVYASRSQILYEADTISNSRYIYQVYRSLAKIYYRIGQINDAIYYVNESVRYLDKDKNQPETWKVESLRFLASIHSEIGDYAKAKAIYDRIEEILIDAPSVTDGNRIDIYRFMSIMHQDSGDKKKALDYALKAKSLMEDKKGFDYYHALASLRLYHVYNDVGQIGEAKEYFIDACEFLGIKSWTEYQFDKPKIDLFKAKDLLNGSIDIYKYFGEVFELDSRQHEEMISVILSMIDDCRALFFYQSSEREFELFVKRFYDLAIADLYDLYSDVDDPKLIKTALSVIDRSRSFNLIRAFNQDDLAAQHGLPSEVVLEEKRLSFLSERAFQEYTKTENNNEERNKAGLVVKMNQLSFAKDSLITLLKDEYPSYYRDRYTINSSSIEEIVALAKESNIGFAVYYWSHQKLYSLFIYGDKLEFHEVEKAKIDKLLIPLLQSLTEREHYSNEVDFKRNRTEFIERCASLLTNLFPENIYNELPEKLVIIPDGKLLNFPFEILLNGDIKEESYRSLPYILREKVISYNGSLSQYTQTANTTIRNEYLGFAPEYSAKRLLASNRNSDHLLSPLIHNQEEVKLSASMFEGLSFTADLATESNFKEHIAKGGVLHLAMHTSLNDKIPLDSYLSFTSEIESSHENSKLYAHEIAQMDIDADLVVLSACETNKGEKINGEAVRGIAKAFYMASCPNLIFSNWLVDDKSSSHIITDFFNEIIGYKSPAESLRKAKLSYLNSSSEVQAHPSYWAAYSYFGSSAVINSPTNMSGSWILFLCLGFLIIFGLVKIL